MNSDEGEMLDQVRDRLDYVIRTSGVPITRIRVDESRNGRRYVDAKIRGKSLFVTRKALEVMSVEEIAALVCVRLTVYKRLGGGSWLYGSWIADLFLILLIPLGGHGWAIPLLALFLVVNTLGILHALRVYRHAKECATTPITVEGIDRGAVQSAALKTMEYSPMPRRRRRRRSKRRPEPTLEEPKQE